MSKPAAQLIQFGNFEADLRAGELYRDRKKIKIQERPFRILDPTDHIRCVLRRVKLGN